jgi:hypothetical protein
MPTPEEKADTLMRKIGSISEPKSRTAVLARAIAKLDDNHAVEVIRIILQRGAQKIPRYQVGFRSLKNIPEVVRHIGPRKMSGIYMLSRERGYEDVTRILQDIPARRTAEDAPEEVYIDVKFKDVALGMKKTLGRLGNRDLVNRLLHDQDPTVIEQLLNNPGLTEDQVVRMAAKRPTSGMVLRQIAKNQKWVSRYRIQRALVCNPYTETQISVRLIGLLMRQDLIEIRRDSALHVELRKAASDILKNKPAHQEYVIEEENGDGENK